MAYTCCMHFESGREKEEVKQFTSISLGTGVEFALNWQQLHCVHAEVARKLGSRIPSSHDLEDVNTAGLGFHRGCYQQFTRRDRLLQLQKHAGRGTDGKGKEQDPTPSTSDGRVSSKKMRLRSVDPLTTTSRRHADILPAVCIFCKKKRKDRLNKISRKRQIEPLQRCETVQNNNLLQTAVEKDDQDLLHHIQGKDLVAIGSGNSSRLLLANPVAEMYGPSVSEALVGLHAFTGCDSVSALKGKGKIRPLQLMLESPAFTDTFLQLGQDWEVTGEQLKKTEEFVCRLHGQKTACVNEARYNIFRLTCKSDHMLPPNSDCYALHSRRANYQTAIWRHCLSSFMSAPLPLGHGWRADTEDSHLSIEWMTTYPTPSSFHQLVRCGCKKNSCETNRCSCKSAGLPCTSLCQCLECTNTQMTPRRAVTAVVTLMIVKTVTQTVTYSVNGQVVFDSLHYCISSMLVIFTVIGVDACIMTALRTCLSIRW